MLTIRRASLDDIDALAQIESESFVTPYSRATLETELTISFSHYFAAVEDNGEIAGFGGFWQVADECHIMNIAVKTSQRRKGIGDAILTHLLDYARSEELVSAFLEVRMSNTAAQHLYEKHGFTACGKRTKYYDNTEDALLMCADIKQVKKD